MYAGKKTSAKPVAMIGVLHAEKGLMCYELKDGYFTAGDIAQFLEVFAEIAKAFQQAGH